jgi:hypothetical protein
MYKERWVTLCAQGLPLDVRIAQAFDTTRPPKLSQTLTDTLLSRGSCAGSGGIPSDLFSQCRQTLLRCREFESYQMLRTVFVTDQLCAFKLRLPSADNPSDLVDRCLEYLIEQRLPGDRLPLPVFLATLRDRYRSGDALWDELDELSRAVQSAMAQSVPRRVQPPHHSQALLDHLLRLDFSEQVRLFRQTIQKHRVAAFLVHGEPNYGQQMLVNRLVRLVPGWRTGQRISIDLGSNGTGKSIRSLWRQVAGKLDASQIAASDQLAEKVCEWWLTQDVIFIFHTVDYMPPDYLSRWIEDFWQPMVVAAHNSLHRTQRETHLVMFLVDYSGCVCSWDVALAQQFEDPEYPRVPLYLPPADRFPSDTLDFWIDIAAEVLPADLTAQVILEASENGVPQIVYEAICDHCGFSWEGELIKWLV